MDYYHIHENLIEKHPRRRAKELVSLANDALAELTRKDPTVYQMMEGISMLCLLSEHPSDVATAKAACKIASALTAAINRRVLRTLNLNDESGIEICHEGDEE
jgi:rhamnogalacturonyl hydrolase YesR